MTPSFLATRRAVADRRPQPLSPCRRPPPGHAGPSDTRGGRHKGSINPRGLNFGPEGGLYVAEAGSGGKGPCIINSNNSVGLLWRHWINHQDHSRRNAVADARRDRLTLSRAADRELGAGGSSTGPHDVEFQGRGNGFVTIGAALNPARRFNDTAHPEFAAVGPEVRPARSLPAERQVVIRGGPVHSRTSQP